MSVRAVIKKKWKGFALDMELGWDGGCLGILGCSGCGKSMTLRCIAGIEKPDEGRIVLNGRTLFDSEKRINLPPGERKIGYLFQNYALFPTMTVEQNIAAALRGPKREKARIVGEQIERFRLTGLEKRRPSELSGGQQQRAALARIFAGQPELLLLDEPFSALDSFLKEALMQEMRRTLGSYGRDAVLVSHSRDEVYYLCGGLVVMSNGKALKAGKTAEVFEFPEFREAAGLTGCKNISAARVLDEHHLYAVDWDMTLKTAQRLDSSIRFAGIRAHDLLPSRGPEGENTFPAMFTGVSEAPFEVHYLFRRAGGDRAGELWWKRAKETARDVPEPELPAYMTLPPAAVMPLKD